jgi:hypothetical protein
MWKSAFALLLAATPAAAEPPLGFDHAIIYAHPGAPEQEALKKAGFTIAPMVNRDDGQGTSSVTVEFLNGFLELIYPDPSVRVAPGMEAVAQKFRDRADWRTTGVSPFALQMHRNATAPAVMPFPTFKVRADWMQPGEQIEILTPRDTPKALGLLIPPSATDIAANVKLAADPVKGAMFRHASGAKRITRVEIVAPSADALPPAATYAARDGTVKFTVGHEWLMILTLDDGSQGKVRDLSPELPLVLRY